MMLAKRAPAARRFLTNTPRHIRANFAREPQQAPSPAPVQHQQQTVDMEALLHDYEHPVSVEEVRALRSRRPQPAAAAL